MTAIAFILAFIAGTVFGATVMGLCMAAKLGEDDPTEHDDHTLESMRRETFDRWRDNRVQHVQD
ncbi:hypothetical protein ACUXAV_000403 [Cupriavidus metallidurans]|uniref:hypothetical protein n=1 Tax=Cupriavidus metallidurans TaxID=119219 RepID=UPI00055F2BCB|nr:hypothetical protein [Cupriavidus metallidurans]MDE4918362.1 hypothetical protein [Cupriavidus metallidurans]